MLVFDLVKEWSHVMEKYTVGVIIGSLSKDSINRKLARALLRLAPSELEFREIRIDALPLYNHDLDENFPRAAREFKQDMDEVDAVLIVTPEYNRSIPGALKNAIDWSSRPREHKSFEHKPTAMIGASSGALGTVVAQQHLRAMLSFLNTPVMTFPEGYIQMKPGLVTDDGDVTVETTLEFLRMYMNEFYKFIDREVRSFQPQQEVMIESMEEKA